MEGVVHGFGAGSPTRRTTDSSSYLTPQDSLWKHGRGGPQKLINQDQTVMKLPHQITNAKFNVHDEHFF